MRIKKSLRLRFIPTIAESNIWSNHFVNLLLGNLSASRKQLWKMVPVSHLATQGTGFAEFGSFFHSTIEKQSSDRWVRHPLQLHFHTAMNIRFPHAFGENSIPTEKRRENSEHQSKSSNLLYQWFQIWVKSKPQSVFLKQSRFKIP